MTDTLLMMDVQSTRLTLDERAFLGEHRVGGVCLFGRNIRDRAQVADLTAELRDLLGPDLLIAIDQEGGTVVRALDVPYPPSMMALGAANDPELTREMGALTAQGLRALGVNVNFAPVADVNHNPRNPVIAERAFGGDPEGVARHVAAFVEGHQAGGVAAVAKHFPGHGDTDTDSHLALPRLEADEARLGRLELPPFRRAVAAGVAGVMSAHIVVPALDPEAPATLSKRVLTGLLREQLGFDGVVFTDALDMRAIAATYSPAKAALRAVTAGADMPLHLGPLSEHEAILRRLGTALTTGELEPEAVARSVTRLRALARRFPISPNPDAAWAPGDEARLEAAAFRGVVALGELPKLEPGTCAALVAASAVGAGGASSAVQVPAEALAVALEAAGVTVIRAFYARGAERELALPLADADVVLFASTSRTRMVGEELKLARAVVQSVRPPQRFVHVALWNPYHALDLPGPAMLTFGFRDPSARAAARALLEGAAPGTAPVALACAQAEGAA